MSDTLILYKSVDFSTVVSPVSERRERNATRSKLYEEGKSSQDIANLYGVSRERVCQILRKANLIERKAQRRRLAAEMLEQDKAEVQAKRLLDEDRIVEHVRGGDSYATAASKVGVSTPVAEWACKKRGVKSTWGRWRDLLPRKERLTALVESGMAITAAMKQVSAEEGRHIAYLWVQSNCPELLKKNRPRIVATVAEAPPPPAPRPPRPITAFPQLEWDEARIYRLLTLWFNGSSSQQIADIFGDCTKNAVIGQVHRLRINGKLRSPA